MKLLLTALSVLTIGTTTGTYSSNLINSSFNEKKYVTNEVSKQTKNNHLFDITLKKLEKLLTKNKHLKNEILLKLYEDHGVTKVESPWYYFGTYEQVYLSNNVVWNMENIERHQDLATAIKWMLEILSPNYWIYVLMVTASLPMFLTNWFAWNPLKYNAGHGIFWGQTVGNIFTGVWSQ